MANVQKFRFLHGFVPNFQSHARPENPLLLAGMQARFALLAFVPLLVLTSSSAISSELTEPFVESRASLTEAGAAKLLESAREEAKARGADVSIAVVDRDGQLLSFRRLGKAAPVTIANAVAKASTAAQLGIPSKELENLVDGGRTSYLAIEGVVPLQGGVPVIIGGAVVGGVGISGASADVDEAIAMAAARALQG